MRPSFPSSSVPSSSVQERRGRRRPCGRRGRLSQSGVQSRRSGVQESGSRGGTSFYCMGDEAWLPYLLASHVLSHHHQPTISLSGGRFMSTFLEHELSFHQNWMISAAMATQLLASSCFSAYFGSVADTWEKRSASNRVDSGRLRMMTYGLLLSTLATLMHSLPRKSHIRGNYVLMYHLGLRFIYAMGTSACVPGKLLTGLGDANISSFARSSGRIDSSAS